MGHMYVYSPNAYWHRLQDHMLVTSDVKALYEIVIKHVDVFDTAEYFLE